MNIRQFPCRACGANVEYEPGTASLVCPYCNADNPIPQSADDVEELDFRKALVHADRPEGVETLAVSCGACGAGFTLQPNVTADRCPFCDAPIVASEAAVRRQIEPWALLPFAIPKKDAGAAQKQWLHGRWFAPSDLVRRANRDAIDGVYLPFWTYDCQTESFYVGQRGHYYYEDEEYETTENGQQVTRTRRVQKTRWSPASGVVWVPFDDVVVPGSERLPTALIAKLEPWDLDRLERYDERYLSGFQAECYQIGLEDGFEHAKRFMDPAIRNACARDIGGDTQVVHTVKTRYDRITFKHILLPVWISAYRYRDRVYRVMINARTGEVVGERPWSAVKITLAVLAMTLLIALILYFAKS